MNPDSTALVKFAAVFMLSAVSGMAQAAFGNCTVSGQAGVIQGFNGTPINGTTWTAEYDPDTNQARITTDGYIACSGPVTQYANTLALCGLTFEKRNGSPVFNFAHFSNRQGSGDGILVDTNGDGLADALELALRYPGAPAALMNIPLQYYPLGTTSPTYWWLPRQLPYAPGLTFDIQADYFTPVNAQTLNLVIQCPGGLTVATGLRTSAVNVGASPVPTASFWGYAAMILLLMLAGIWMLRRRGFGNDFDLRA